jgi:hypothetical protein
MRDLQTMRTPRASKKLPPHTEHLDLACGYKSGIFALRVWTAIVNAQDVGPQPRTLMALGSLLLQA